MIRYSLLWVFIACVVAYSWKDWFRALCVLMMIVAVLERPDMPASMFGIAGLNPLNIGLVGVLIAAALSPNRQRGEWDAPRWFTLSLVLLVSVMAIGFVRLFADPGNLLTTAGGVNVSRYTKAGLVLEFFFNTFKWMIPGLLIFRGCRSRRDHQWAVLCLMGFYFVLAVQTIKVMPLPYLLDGEALEQRAVRVLEREIGYHRVELAGAFAGAFWAMLAVRPLFHSRFIRLGLLASSGATALALALTAGRTGYGTWCVLGLLMAGLRWRRVLFMGPVGIVVLTVLAPGVTQRFLQGISYDEKGQARTVGEADLYTVTAGRSVLWPFVLESIGARPVFGYGREAMNRNGLAETVFQDTGEVFGHPHNGYFQFTLDNGLVGLMVFLSFVTPLGFLSVSLFRQKDPQASAAGGMALVILAAFLVAATGAQTFYPTEVSFAVWCAIGLLMRIATRTRPFDALVPSTSTPAFVKGRRARQRVRPASAFTVAKEQVIRGVSRDIRGDRPADAASRLHRRPFTS